jgi:hypothetical protein
MVHEWTAGISPARPFTEGVDVPAAVDEADLTLLILDGDHELVMWSPRQPADNRDEPWAATEPAPPSAMEKPG